MKRSAAAEMMDSADNPRELLEEDLRNLRRLNRYLGGARCVRHGIAQFVRRQNLRQLAVLDVGAGSGDVATEIVRWCRDNHIDSTVVSLDRDPVTVAVAATQVAGWREIAVLRGDALAPPFAPKRFDCVLASQFLHHFSEAEIVALLQTWATLARRAIVVSDLVRHPLAYYGIRALTRMSTKNIMTRTDAPLSVQRAFTLAEWRELFRRAGVGKFQVTPLLPFRMSAWIEIAS
jgi:SAM-dependent methyltransferase